MRQASYCSDVAVLPGTDFRIRPKFLDMLSLPEAWKFGRGAGVRVAVIDTGVTPHPRLPHLVGGGDYVMDGGDGLSDCDAHGTIVASLIGAAPADGSFGLEPQETRRPPSVPTTEAPPPAPPPPPPQTVTVEVPAPQPPPPPTPADGPPLAPGFAPGIDAPAPPLIPTPSPEIAPASLSTASGTTTVTSRALFHGVHPLQNAPAPSAPPMSPPETDGFTGVAPDAEIISIRVSSQMFATKDPYGDGMDPQTRQTASLIRTIARAVVYAADMGAQVINLSKVACLDARNVSEQVELGAALRYVTVDRNVLVVASAGDVGDHDCKQNPPPGPARADDPRGWNSVTTVATPSWFDEYVLTVGAVDSDGTFLDKSSVSGPWVSLAAPATDLVSLSPRDDGLINAVAGPDNTTLVPTGPGFAAALVSGVAALVRARYPQLSAMQVRNRLVQTARAPARGVDNEVGHGIVDPVAALTWDVPDERREPPQQMSAPLPVPAIPPKPDATPIWVASGALVLLVLGASATSGVLKLTRRGSEQR